MNVPQGLRPGHIYDRLIRNRLIIIWGHVLLGAFAGLSYLATSTPAGFAYWRPRASISMLELSSLAMLPYLFSGPYAYKRVGADIARVLAFLTILAVGTLGGAYWYLTIRDRERTGGTTALIVFIQTIVFTNAGRWCFGRNALPR